MTRFALLLSSYAPLLLIFAIRFEDPPLRLGCFLVAVVGVGSLVWVLRTHSANTAAGTVDVVKVEDAGSEATAYLVTYLLPFVTIAQPDPATLLSYVVLYLVVAAIYLRSDLIIVNPTLFVFGWHLSKATTEGGRTLYAITRGRLVTGKFPSVEITQGIAIQAALHGGTRR